MYFCSMIGVRVSVYSMRSSVQVGEDEAMAVLEAMKMQDVLRSPGDFKVNLITPNGK